MTCVKADLYLTSPKEIQLTCTGTWTLRVDRSGLYNVVLFASYYSYSYSYSYYYYDYYYYYD